jgi:hypothetical protein
MDHAGPLLSHLAEPRTCLLTDFLMFSTLGFSDVYIGIFNVSLHRNFPMFLLHINFPMFRLVLYSNFLVFILYSDFPIFLLYRLKAPNLIVKYYDSMYSLWRHLNAHFVSRRGRILHTYLLTPASEGCRLVQFRGPLGCAQPWHDSATSA